MGINSPKHTLRRAKHITNPKDIEYILSLTEDQAAEKSTIMDLFADFGDGRAETCLYGPSYTISKGDRIAQLVLQEVPTALFVETPDISKIGGDRNGGFGSTGVK